MIETISPDLLLAGDEDHAWLLQHLLDPYAPEHHPANPCHLVTDYLGRVHDLLGVTREAVAQLADTAPDADGCGPAIDEKGCWLRWAASYELGEALVVLIQQTEAVRTVGGRLRGLDVEGAGLRIVVERRRGTPFAIRGVASTLVQDVRVSPQEKVDPDLKLTAAVSDRLLVSLGYAPLDLRMMEALNVEFRLHKFQGSPKGVVMPMLDSKPVLVEGQYYPSVIISLPTRSLRADPRAAPVPVEFTVWLRWNPDQSIDPVVLRQITQITHANARPTGEVFLHDPVTASGNVVLKPSASPATLNPFRHEVTLPRLKKPIPKARWTLDGDRVGIVGGDQEGIPGTTDAAPPSLSIPKFSFGARTNEFAAVNAYYHCEAMLSKLDSLGVAFASFPLIARKQIRARLEVIARASIVPGPCHDGNCVNAQALLQTPPIGPQLVQLRFALADLHRNPGAPGRPIEPLGIATDVRVVWHEFCHALIVAATKRLEFPFCHSAGDALAAIMGDPQSGLAWPKHSHWKPSWRYVTYPWGTTPGRRHDRSASHGWSWSGPLGTARGYRHDSRDMAGYAREQVLSSTLFRFYRAIGGDAVKGHGLPDEVVRQEAADYACYLIVSAIKSLGSVLTAPALNAAHFWLALLAADFARLKGPAPCPRRGGTTHKVMSWAFEQQGLPPLRMFHAGFPPDVYVANDKRNGSYEWTPDWRVRAEGIWNRRVPDGKDSDETPQPGKTNYIYVAVRNRYSDPQIVPPRLAQNVSVTVYASSKMPTAFPGNAWKKLATSSPQSQTAPGEKLLFGPFPWTASSGTTLVLAAAEAWGDRSNINPLALLPALSAPTRLDQLVPFDNNLGLREIKP